MRSPRTDTLAIDDELLREARVKALEQGTSVNEVCRQTIEGLANRNEAGERLAAGLRASFANALPRPPGAGPAWEGREVLYAPRLGAIGRQRKR
ncbi:MAG: hypothetical protein Q8K45_05295 [Rubrivivax sp.]|nr:hypothetical protein [Rubrivivax sp.]